MTYRVEVVEGNMHEAVHGGTEPGLEGGRRIHITYISNEVINGGGPNPALGQDGGHGRGTREGCTECDIEETAKVDPLHIIMHHIIIMR